MISSLPFLCRTDLPFDVTSTLVCLSPSVWDFGLIWDGGLLQWHFQCHPWCLWLWVYVLSMGSVYRFFCFNLDMASATTFFLPAMCLNTILYSFSSSIHLFRVGFSCYPRRMVLKVYDCSVGCTVLSLDRTEFFYWLVCCIHFFHHDIIILLCSTEATWKICNWY